MPIDPSSSGIVPENALLSSCSTCNDIIFDIDCGITPWKLLEFNFLSKRKVRATFPNLESTYKVVRYCSEVNDGGNVPESSLN